MFLYETDKKLTAGIKIHVNTDNDHQIVVTNNQVYLRTFFWLVQHIEQKQYELEQSSYLIFRIDFLSSFSLFQNYVVKFYHTLIVKQYMHFVLKIVKFHCNG